MSETHINVNFEDVPDEYPTVAAGVYEAAFVDAPSIDEVDTRNGPAKKVGFSLQITHADDPDNEEYVGQRVFDSIWLGEKSHVRLKRMANSAGVVAGADGLDLNEFDGKVARIRVKQQADKTDPDKKWVRVADFLPPA